MTLDRGDETRPSRPDREEARATEDAGGPSAVFTRRALLTGAGRAAAAGAALSAGGTLIAPSTAEAAGDRVVVADGPRDGTTLEFVARVQQDGDTLSGAGYLTFVDGLDADVLFTDPDARSEATARFTATASATLTGRSVLDNVFAIDAQGQLTVRFQDSPGPGGQVVAVYDVTLQDILTVIAPNAGIPTVSGDLEQRLAAGFTIGARRYRFGRPNLRLRLGAAGSGVRTDATAPRATLTLAGNVVAVA